MHERVIGGSSRLSFNGFVTEERDGVSDVDGEGVRRFEVAGKVGKCMANKDGDSIGATDDLLSHHVAETDHGLN